MGSWGFEPPVKGLEVFSASHEGGVFKGASLLDFGAFMRGGGES